MDFQQAFDTEVCSSSNDLCQSSHHTWYWVCRDNNYHFPTLDRFFFFSFSEIQSYRMWWGAASPILNDTPVVCIYTSYNITHMKNAYICIYLYIYWHRPSGREQRSSGGNTSSVRCVRSTAAHWGLPFYMGIRRNYPRSKYHNYCLYITNIMYDGSDDIGQLNWSKI